MEINSADLLTVLVGYKVCTPPASRCWLLYNLFLIRLKCLILLIGRRGRIQLRCFLRFHTYLHTALQNRNSVNGAGHLLVGKAGSDGHRIVRIIYEPEIRPTVADCRVLARSHIGRLVAVRMALCTFQSCKDDCIVESGRNLTHAAARFLNYLTVQICRSRLIALLCGTRSCSLIK